MSLLPKLDGAGRVRWLFVISLALNVFFVGAAGAVAFRYGGAGTVPLSNIAQINRDVANRLNQIAASLPAADAEVVRSELRANAEKVLAALGIGQRLPVLVIGGELARSKPDPLPYLTALERTGASAAHSVAFEDSLSGVRAAAAAGLAVVGMMTTLDSRTLIEAGATFAASNFTDPRIFQLIETRLNSGAEEGAKV